MPSRFALILFILFAPVTVPVYLLFLVVANLIAGAFYIVFEAALSPLLGRPIALSRGTMALLTIPVLVAAPLVAIALAVVGLLRWIVKALAALGRWQAGATSRGTAVAAGFVWFVVALWTTLACMNAAWGGSLIGRPIQGRELFVEHVARGRMLRQMPESMQAKRRELIAHLKEHQSAAHWEWRYLLADLEDDQAPFDGLTPTVQKRLTGMAWYFIPSEVSTDGQDHSLLLLGAMLFVWVLLIRWPGMFGAARWSWSRWCLYGVRVGVAAYAIYSLLAWEPTTLYHRFFFGDSPELPFSFRFFSPALWLGMDCESFVRLEWYYFNAALWLVLIGVASMIWWLSWRVSPFLGWPRFYVAFLAARLLQHKRIAFFSVGAVTLCVAMMIIVISVMGGFVDSIRDKAHGLLGDLVMDGSLQGFPYYQGFIDRISKLTDPKSGKPIVVQATPLVRTVGILQFPASKSARNVGILGIRLNEYVRTTQFGSDLFYNQRFGSTSLGRQGQPYYGFDEAGAAALPGEMDARWNAYLASLSDEARREELQRYTRRPGELFPGPGVFAGPKEKPVIEGTEWPGIIIGRSIVARRLPTGEYKRSETLPRGERVMLTIVPLTRSGDISTEPPPKAVFRYADDSRTGIHEIDSQNVYVDFDELQRLLSMEPQKRSDGTTASARCSQILINLDEQFSRLGDRQTLQRYKALIESEWLKHLETIKPDALEVGMLANVGIQTWEEMQATYISAIEKEKFLVLIMFGVISIVAVFMIFCVFHMIVQEKTRDIGIIKSLGGSAAGVSAVFLAYGAAIGLVGCVFGSMLGISFIDHINEIQDWLARLNPEWRVWSPETYSFDRIPSAWKWSEVIGIGILSIVSALLGALVPAVRAGRTWPVETLRYE